MSDYEYDTGSTRLVISEGLNIRDDKHFVIVSAEHVNDVNIAVAVQDEDAPAVALAILEAAGVDYERYVTMPPASDDIDELCACAAQTLRLAVRQWANKAERDAEDAKAKAYRVALFPGAVKWEHLDEEIREAHRTRYRTARKFFEDS